MTKFVKKPKIHTMKTFKLVVILIITNLLFNCVQLSYTSYETYVFASHKKLSERYIINDNFLEAYYIDEEDNDGYSTGIVFKLKGSTPLQITEVNCKQLYKGKDISRPYEYLNKTPLPLDLSPDKRSITVSFLMDFEDIDFKIADKIIMEIAVKYKTEEKEYSASIIAIKTFEKKTFTVDRDLYQ